MFPVQKLLPTVPLQRHGTIQGAFDAEEIDRITFFEKIIEFDDAKVGDGQEGSVDPNTRITKTGWLPIDENTGFIFEKLASIVSQANYDLFLYNIDHIENLQYTIYHGSDDAYYGWHRDSSLHGYVPMDRMISGVLMLSDPSDYKGGDLKIDLSGGDQNRATDITLNKGDVILFDSSMHHCVTPVSEGIRKTLVFWVRGKGQIQ
jgi:PKHD-type hydroxylase